MTVPDPTTPSTGGSLVRALSSPRVLAAWALVAYAALFGFFEFAEWILPDGGSFSGRSASAGFTDLFIMAMPVLAVVLAAYLTPPAPWAKLITTIALIEYAVALLLGLITFLIGLGAVFDNGINDPGDGLDAFRYLVMGLVDLVMVAGAAYVVLRAFTSLGGRLPINRPA